MADFAGAAFDHPTTRHDGRVRTPNFDYRGDYATLEALTPPYDSGSRAAGAPGSASTGQNAVSGLDWPEGSCGLDWFERVHILPRTPIDFGLVVTTVTAEYELFNAHRKTTAVFNTLAINVGAGVTLPDLPTPPANLGPFASFKGPTSTRFSSAPGFVHLVVSVGPDGPPTFDGTIDFTFGPGGVVSLSLSGQRIALIPARYESPVRETLSFLTDIIEMIDGSEQRIALRKNPRQLLDVEYLLDLDERQRMQVLLMGWQGNAFAVPVWHEEMELSAAASVGATSVTVPSTADVDLRVGGLAVVIESELKYDVLVVSAVGATSVTFATTPLTNSYAARAAKVVPVRTAFVVGAVTGGRYLNSLERFRVKFLSTDNDTGALTGSTAGWNTYDGKVLLDDCNSVESEAAFDLTQRVTVIDNRTGVVYQGSRWPRNKRTVDKGFTARNRADVLKLKRLLIALRGRQTSVWVPTHIEDLTVAANLVSGSTTMDIGHVGYVRFARNLEPKRTFRITFTDGTSLVREVQSSVQVSSTVERLTLDTTWPANRTVAEVDRVQFYELCRLDTDDVVLEIPRPGLATTVVPMKLTFDA